MAEAGTSRPEIAFRDFFRGPSSNSTSRHIGRRIMSTSRWLGACSLHDIRASGSFFDSEFPPNHFRLDGFMRYSLLLLLLLFPLFLLMLLKLLLSTPAFDFLADFFERVNLFFDETCKPPSTSTSALVYSAIVSKHAVGRIKRKQKTTCRE